MKPLFKVITVNEPRSVNDRGWAKQALHNEFRGYLASKFGWGRAGGFAVRLPKGHTTLEDGTILTTRRALFAALVLGA